jgi:NAD+-processing family protein with receiver domain
VGKIVAILEDDVNRIAAMRAGLAAVLPVPEIVVFEHAGRMIEWLRTYLVEVVLISLDHDLPLREVDGKMIDCGTGREVADFLRSLRATCPIIVHSSNDVCATGMFFALKEAGWPVKRVYPCGDLAWIESAWVATMLRLVHQGKINIGAR